MLNTATVDEKGIHNIVSINRMALAPGNDRRNDETNQNLGMPGRERERNGDRTDQNNCMPGAEYSTSEDGSDGNHARIVGFFFSAAHSQVRWDQ